MTALYSLSMAVWQTTDVGLPVRDKNWLLICIGVIAGAMLFQAIVTIAASFAAMKTMKEFKSLAHDLHSRATPIMQKTTEVINDLSPKIRTVSENVTQISYTVREKVDEVGGTITQVNRTVAEINRTVAETNQKTRGQVEHVDRMVKTALDTTEEIGQTVANGIRGPLKQVAGLIAGLRAGIETLVKNFAPRSGPRV
jgi:methyl-accepting chemotaxis protein